MRVFSEGNRDLTRGRDANQCWPFAMHSFPILTNEMGIERSPAAAGPNCKLYCARAQAIQSKMQIEAAAGQESYCISG